MPDSLMIRPGNADGSGGEPLGCAIDNKGRARALEKELVVPVIPQGGGSTAGNTEASRQGQHGRALVNAPGEYLDPQCAVVKGGGGSDDLERRAKCIMDAGFGIGGTPGVQVDHELRRRTGKLTDTADVAAVELTAPQMIRVRADAAVVQKVAFRKRPLNRVVETPAFEKFPDGQDITG